MVLKVSINYGALKADFEGEPEEVYRSVVKFMEKNLPAYSLASKLAAAQGVEDILAKIKNFVVYDSTSGLYLKADLSKLPASAAVLVFAAVRHLNHLLGHSETSEFLSSEVADALGRSEKTVSGRLTELVKRGQLKRLSRGGYCITPAGLIHVAEFSPEI
ncbi:MAG: hypothetical protein RMI49_00075 [Candidatus Caldarchaeum sp.]|nr:hypothetical protein [Candidatus Caldarchaeum sp.]